MKSTITVAALACAATACTSTQEPVSTPQPAPAVAQQTAPIVMGRQAQANETLSTVALTDPSGHFFCTGTLVAPTVVVSAAHCFMNEDESGWIRPADMQIGFDSLDATPVPAARRVAVERFTLHPEYAVFGAESGRADGLGRDNDIAVIVLAAPADQRPTPVLPMGMLDQVGARTMLTISGYGITDLDEARDRSGTLHIGETPFIERSDYEFIAGGRGVTDTCNGDSGGPAYVTIDGQRYLLGATSRAAHDANAMCGDRGIYALVPAYAEWIEAVAAGDAAALTDPPALNGGGGGDWGEGEGEWDEGEGEWGEGEWEEGEWEEGAECIDPDAEYDDGEPEADVCAEEGFYGDEICDDFCDRPDPDCEGLPACDEAGAEGGEPEGEGEWDEGEGEWDEGEGEGEWDEGDLDDGNLDEGDLDEGDLDEGDLDEGDLDEGDAPAGDEDGILELDDADSDTPTIDAVRDELGCTTAMGGTGAGWWMMLPFAGLIALRRRRR